jgi:hypothetical protein
MEKKYGALRIIATLNTVIGWIILVIGSLAAVGVIFSAGFIFGFPILMASLFIGLILIAAGELIYVIIDIEENTRQGSMKSNHEITTNNLVESKKSTNIKTENTSLSALTDNEKLIVESSLKKLNSNGYILINFDSDKINWTLRSTTNSAEFEVNYKQLIELSNNF